MARYELGAVYKIEGGNKTYYARLVGKDCYGIYAPFEENPSEQVSEKTPYRLYIVCNSFPVKRGILEKVLPSPAPKDTKRWQAPERANYANFNPALFLRQHRIFRQDGNIYECGKEHFIALVKAGMIEHIFNRHEHIPNFLERYCDGYPESYILEEAWLKSGTIEAQREKAAALKEMGFTVDELADG